LPIDTENKVREDGKKSKKDREVACNVTMRRVRATIVAVENNEYYIL
jgi:hypothetical protein